MLIPSKQVFSKFMQPASVAARCAASIRMVKNCKIFKQIKVLELQHFSCPKNQFILKRNFEKLEVFYKNF